MMVISRGMASGVQNEHS